MADSANEHIRVSEETKARLRKRKQENESFDDVVRRLLEDDRDLLAGFGAGDEREGETLAETVARRKERSHRRIEDLAEGREENEA
ncbi:MAG: antitoxin VapB family protein [Halobacteriales archaeon]